MNPPFPILLDCDPGTDDAVAILLALASPEIALHAITVVGGNVGIERTLANALALTALVGASVPAMPGRGFLRIREEKPGWEPGEGFASFGF